MVVSQYLHEQVLRDHVEKLGAKVELGTELVGISQDSENVTVDLAKCEGGEKTVEQATFKYVVGADGGKSAQRLFPR